jgi:hypothetical protein
MTNPRRWFQIHLSTAILLLLFIGAVLGLNLRRQSEVLIFSQAGDAFGWPYPIVAQQPTGHGFYQWRFLLQSLVSNLIVWSLIFWVLKFICEYFIRRRAKP